jgi:hypothetical protein
MGECSANDRALALGIRRAGLNRTLSGGDALKRLSGIETIWNLCRVDALVKKGIAS